MTQSNTALWTPWTLSRRSCLGTALAYGVRGASLSGLASLGLPAVAQTYPTRSVRLVVPFPAGGPVDTTGRALAHQLSSAWGQQALIDNRAGAGGLVGAEVAAKSTPDGYTLLVCSIHHAVLPSLHAKLSYDIERDFVPVSFVAYFPVILVVHPSLPVHSVADLIALDRAQPGTLSFGSSGNGGGTHLAGELFNMQAGTQLLHVPYKGSAPAMSDLLGRQVQIMFSDAPTALPQIRAGKLRALALAGAQRSTLLPDLPTIAESGLPGYEASSWAAVVAPAATPAAIVTQLSADIGQALGHANVKQRLQDIGAETAAGTPDELRRFLRQEIVKWGEVVRKAQIRID